ncbi:uncharacterized protein LTR77_001982 [Saxophila tyrrhenica]|uniref:Uncharacterized protein n=1 Tax=Saxophila tyrrhenica TaxID=1690608 RepID=A0AAV9PJ17_9PEZI|nr:hypothetical protein LTR77_001982 [Saxophila tyrrhenica]
MKFSHTLIAAAAAPLVTAQRPSNESICDYYSNLLLGGSNATTQLKLLTLLVNTAVIGNYSEGKVMVPGILAKDAMYNGTKVNLVPYFSGALKSTNVGEKHGVSYNFLDGGGAAPLAKSKPADDDTSHQAILLNKLYSYFGVLLACSAIGKDGFPAYNGKTSMYNVHKYMALDSYEVGYFIEQVGLAATSFGVSTGDVELVGYTLQGYFGNKCAPKTSVMSKWKKELQSICIADDCPDSPNATCKVYGKVVEPAAVVTSHSNMASPTSNGGDGDGGKETAAPSATGNNGAATLQLSAVVALLSVGMLAFHLA